MRRISLVALVACTPPAPERTTPLEPIIWLVPGRNATAIVQPIDRAASASPEALRQYFHSKAAIVHRQALSDGFTATFAGETHVLRERHNRWFRCHAPVTDDAMRDEVIAACKSYKLPAKP